MNERRGEHVVRNRAAWNVLAARYVEPGRRHWRSEPSWGVWHIPESELCLLPDVRGRDAVELGCGTAYVSAWLARRGARVVGIDNSPAQLATARVPPRPRRLDQAAEEIRVRDRRPRRAAPAGGRHDDLPLRERRLVTALALGGGVGGTPTLTFELAATVAQIGQRRSGG